MNVAELIAELQKYPANIVVEVNDNYGGKVSSISSVDFFEADGVYNDPAVVMIQINCY